MKDLKKLFVLLLAGAMAFSLVACNNGEGNGVEVTPTAIPNYKETTSGLSDTQLSNYFLKFSATETVTEQNEETGEMTTQEKTTNYIEVGYSGLYLISEDGGESFNVAGTSSFAVSSQTSIFGTFSAHKQYEASGTELEKIGDETIADMQTTHYSYKSGPLKINMNVNADYDVCLKYEREGLNALKMEVQELKFGVIGQDGYIFSDFQARIVTPAPTEEAPAEEQPAA